MNKIVLIIVSLILALAVGLVAGCGEVRSLLGPNPEIVSREAYDTVVEGDYSVVVLVDIVNRGRSGNVEVIAEVWWQGDYWKKSKVVYITEGTQRKVYLVFKGPTFLGTLFGVLTGQPGFKYRVDVKP
ncbi:unnamed protein product [marine sediment metagenome]|uniref:DUF1425 domain-containing protein n=1 Tax=marine sediment metagenome TaxID=412755 RepID=X1STN0_9ZZZZ